MFLFCLPPFDEKQHTTYEAHIVSRSFTSHIIVE